jgi:hypothetical protein
LKLIKELNLGYKLFAITGNNAGNIGTLCAALFKCLKKTYNELHNPDEAICHFTIIKYIDFTFDIIGLPRIKKFNMQPLYVGACITIGQTEVEQLRVITHITTKNKADNKITKLYVSSVQVPFLSDPMSPRPLPACHEELQISHDFSTPCLLSVPNNILWIFEQGLQ